MKEDILALVIAAVVAAALFFTGLHFGSKSERASWQQKELKLLKAHRLEMEKEVDKRERARLFNEAKARKATQAHEEALEAVRKEYDVVVADLKRRGGLRIPATACTRPAAAAGQAAGAGRPDEADAKTIQLPAGIEDGLFKLARRADDLVEQCRALQSWARDNGFYGEPDDGIPRP